MNAISTERRAILEREALEFYRAHRGRLLEVTWVSGYNDRDDSEDLMTDPIIVRVDRTNEHDILHWSDEWLDPYWDVTLVRGDVRGLRSLWIDGPSVNALTGISEWKNVRVLGWLESMLVRLGIK